LRKERVILIADRNPHIREFLQRELTAEGYRVCLAENGRQVLQWAGHGDLIDLLILDPDLPDMNEAVLLKELQERTPVLPIILHTWIADYDPGAAFLKGTHFVQKNGSSVESLKHAAIDLLGHPRQR
jgi:DNA-binding NtrC family response regulator